LIDWEKSGKKNKKEFKKANSVILESVRKPVNKNGA